MRKKVFVTGGGGFIGSHLIEKLVKDGYSVKTIVPYNIDNSWGWLDFVENRIKNKPRTTIPKSFFLNFSVIILPNLA